MSGLENDVLVAKNVNFDYTSNPPHSGILTAGGDLIVGTGSTPEALKGTLTSPDTSLTIGYSSPNITLQVAGGSTVGKTITGVTGGPLSPTNGNWNIIGSPGVTTSGSVSTLTISPANDLAAVEALSTTGLATRTASETWTTRTITAGDGTSVTNGNGVSGNPTISVATGLGLNWSTITTPGPTQAFARSGFIANSTTGTAVFTIPAGQSVGDLFIIVGKGSSGWSIAQTGSKQIFFGNQATTAGVGGSLASTDAHDVVCLVATNTTTDWQVIYSIGNLTVT